MIDALVIPERMHLPEPPLAFGHGISSPMTKQAGTVLPGAQALAVAVAVAVVGGRSNTTAALLTPPTWPQHCSPYRGSGRILSLHTT